MYDKLTVVFIPGAWHKPSCYGKLIEPLQDEHNIKCVSVTLPSTTDNPSATFKDDINAARDAIIHETTQGRNVIVIAHSFGGMVGNSAIRGLTQPTSSNVTESNHNGTGVQPWSSGVGYVTALILIASGFTITGYAFMDPLFGMTPPSWKADKDTGYATLVANPREFFYHDLPDDEADYWVSQLTTQSLKALFEGGEHAYAGWQDVPVWYVGTFEDKGLPVVLQRVQVGTARAIGAIVHHIELKSSHSPFLSMPENVLEVILEAARTVGETAVQTEDAVEPSIKEGSNNPNAPMVKFSNPSTWFSFGIPYLFGRALGWGFMGFIRLRTFWRR